MILTVTDLRHLRVAEGWLELGIHGEAIAELEEIDPLNRSHPKILLFKSRVYLSANKLDEARTILSSLSECVPDFPDALFYLACAHAKKGDYTAAEQALKKCIAIANPMNQKRKWALVASLTKELEPFRSFTKSVF